MAQTPEQAAEHPHVVMVADTRGVVHKVVTEAGLDGSYYHVADMADILRQLRAEIAALTARVVALEVTAKTAATARPRNPRIVALRSQKNGKLLCVDEGDHAIANRDVVGAWELFELIPIEE